MGCDYFIVLENPGRVVSRELESPGNKPFFLEIPRERRVALCMNLVYLCISMVSSMVHYLWWLHSPRKPSESDFWRPV